MTAKPTKVTIRCEHDSAHSVQVKGYTDSSTPYFDVEVRPGEQAVFDVHADIYVAVETIKTAKKS